jgi:hypothetical protein
LCGVGCNDNGKALDNANQAIFNEREKRYGIYQDGAYICENIKAAFRKSKNWEVLDPDQKLSLDMVALKISRALNGDPNYSDNWRDASVFFMMVADRLDKEVMK